MNDEVGSIMAACYELHPVQVYTERMPQDFVIPSMYFPQPLSSDGGDTLSTYRKDYSLAIKFFAKTDEQAGGAVEHVADAIRADRFIIPLIAEDGRQTNEYMRLTRLESRVIDEGVAQLSITWTSRYKYNRVAYEKMGYLFLREARRP